MAHKRGQTCRSTFKAIRATLKRCSSNPWHRFQLCEFIPSEQTQTNIILDYVPGISGKHMELEIAASEQRCYWYLEKKTVLRIAC